MHAVQQEQGTKRCSLRELDEARAPPMQLVAHGVQQDDMRINCQCVSGLKKLGRVF
jgi:hypothetical protein